MDTPVSVCRSSLDWRLATAVCVCGWRGRTRRHYGDAHRDKISHRRECPYRHQRSYTPGGPDPRARRKRLARGGLGPEAGARLCDG